MRDIHFQHLRQPLFFWPAAGGPHPSHRWRFSQSILNICGQPLVLATDFLIMDSGGAETHGRADCTTQGATQDSVLLPANVCPTALPLQLRHDSIGPSFATHKLGDRGRTVSPYHKKERVVSCWKTFIYWSLTVSVGENTKLHCPYTSYTEKVFNTLESVLRGSCSSSGWTLYIQEETSHGCLKQWMDERWKAALPCRYGCSSGKIQN